MKNHKQQFIYGHHAVKAALENEERDVICYYYQEPNELLTQANTRGIESKKLAKQEFNNMLKVTNHQMCAVSAMPLAMRDLKKDIDMLCQRQKLRFAICDQITDVHNIGAILRSCHVFGIDALIMQQRQSPQENSVMCHISSGAIEYVPIYHVVNIARTIDWLKQYDFWAIGFVEDAKKTLQDIELADKMLYILGNEGYGIRPNVQASCDDMARIAMADNHIGSLNVSASAAVIFHHYFNKA